MKCGTSGRPSSQAGETSHISPHPQPSSPGGKRPHPQQPRPAPPSQHLARPLGNPLVSPRVGAGLCYTSSGKENKLADALGLAHPQCPQTPTSTKRPAGLGIPLLAAQRACEGWRLLSSIRRWVVRAQSGLGGEGKGVDGVGRAQHCGAGAPQKLPGEGRQSTPQGVPSKKRQMSPSFPNPTHSGADLSPPAGVSLPTTSTPR